MFINRKTTAGKVYVYRMLLSLKTLVTYKKNLTASRTTLSVVKQLLSDITRFFVEHRPMPGAYSQA